LAARQLASSPPPYQPRYPCRNVRTTNSCFPLAMSALKYFLCVGRGDIDELAFDDLCVSRWHRANLALKSYQKLTGSSPFAACNNLVGAQTPSCIFSDCSTSQASKAAFSQDAAKVALVTLIFSICSPPGWSSRRDWHQIPLQEWNSLQ
jgi:hypothetical protein